MTERQFAVRERIVDDLGDFRHATQDRRNPRCGERINLQSWKAVMQAHEQRLRHDRIADPGRCNH